MNKKQNIISEEDLKSVTGGLLDPEYALRGKKEDTAENPPTGEGVSWVEGIP